MADQRTATVSQLVQARFDWSHVLHELGRVLPAGTALGSLHGTVGAAGSRLKRCDDRRGRDAGFEHSAGEHTGVHAHRLR